MDGQAARRATLLIMALFLLQPLAIGGWLALIPHVKTTLELSKGELALALLGMPLALIPSLQVAGRLIAQSGPRRIFKVAFPAQAVAVMLPLAAWNGVSLFLMLAALGVTAAFMEVGINVYAGRLEKRASLMIMNRCHGFWALGITFGSFAVALFATISPSGSLGVLAVLSALLGLWATYALPKIGDDETGIAPPRRRIVQLPPALIFVAVFMFFVTMTEGAMADWAAVHLAERLGGVEERAGLAVTIFSAFMAAGRFSGDWLKRKMGGVTLAQMTTTCAVLGLLLITVPLPLVVLYFGFALVGFGVSSAYPLGVSAIAALDDTYESTNIAIMATVALGGFLVGPPVIGLISETFSLSAGLAALIPGLILSVWLTKWLGARPEPEKSVEVR